MVEYTYELGDTFHTDDEIIEIYMAAIKASHPNAEAIRIDEFMDEDDGSITLRALVLRDGGEEVCEHTQTFLASTITYLEPAQ